MGFWVGGVTRMPGRPAPGGGVPRGRVRGRGSRRAPVRFVGGLACLALAALVLPPASVSAHGVLPFISGVAGVRCVRRDPWVCYAPARTVKVRLTLTAAGRGYVRRRGIGLYTLGKSVVATLDGTLTQAIGLLGLPSGRPAGPSLELEATAPTTVLLPLGGTPTAPAVKIYLGVPSLPPWPRLPLRTALPASNLASPDTGLLGSGQNMAYRNALERAQRIEGARAFRLPGNFDNLTDAEQLFVLVNLMRVTRGLWPLVGMTTSLDRLAEAGARAGTDPVDRSAGTWSSNWYSGTSPLAAVYDWMYLDGPGPDGLNIDCRPGNMTGCWGHRKNILSDVGPYGVMGSAFAAPTGNAGGTAALFVRGLSPRPAGLTYSWAQAVRAGARPAF